MKIQRLIQARVFLLCLFVLMSVRIPALAATDASSSFYVENWKQVTAFIEAGKPESALEQVALIEKQAKADNNNPQQIKARVIKIKLTVQIDPDQLSTQLADIETLTAESTDETMKAMLRSITAEMYIDYYKKNTYRLNNRTPMAGPVSANMNTWSGNVFTDTIRTLLAKSLVPAERLQTTSVESVKEVLTVLYTPIEPSLYDVLVRRRIVLLNGLREAQTDRNLNMEPTSLFEPVEKFITLQVKDAFVSDVEKDIISTLQQWLRFRLQDGKTEALIHADLYRLQTLFTMVYPQTVQLTNFTELTSDQQTYLKTLQALSARYADNEAVVTALWAEAQFYLAFHREGDSPFKDYKYKAYALCVKGLKQFPNASKSRILKDYVDIITKQGISVTGNAVVKHKKPLTVSVHASNTENAELTVYRVNLTAKEFLLKHKNREDTLAMDYCTVLEKRLVTFKRDTLFSAIDTSLVIKGLPYGQYGYSLRIPGEKGLTVNAFFVVSDMASMTISNYTTLCVVDRVSGKPLPQVDVQVFSYPDGTKDYVFDTPSAAGKTNDKGFFSYSVGTVANSARPNRLNNVLFYERGADRYLTSQHTFFPTPGIRDDYDENGSRLELLTDRSVYRPGQTVYFKGIAYHVDKTVQRVLPNESYVVELVDANYQTIGKQTFTTNAFGSFSGTFVLPETGKSGSFSLRSERGSEYFQVEEYKRPTFEVVLEKQEADVHFGQTVTVTGNVKAYAGYPVTGATVTYRVFRRSHQRSWNAIEEQEVITGTTRTGSDGTFAVSFLPERVKNSSSLQYHTYEIKATVTDQKGETQVGQRSVSVGDKSLFVVAVLPFGTTIDKTVGRPIKIQVETLDGVNVPAEVAYELYLLDPSNDYVDVDDVTGRNRLYPTFGSDGPQRKPGRPVTSGRLHTQDGPLTLDYAGLKSGTYQLVCTTNDSRGQLVSSVCSFDLFAPTDKRIPMKAYAWVNTSVGYTNEYAIGDTAVIHFGTAAKDVHVLYRVEKDRVCLDSAWIPMSNTLKAFTLPYEDRYGDGVSVQFLFVKDEQLFTRTVLLQFNSTDKWLNPALTVFRNKLRPGETAEWTLTIPELKSLNKQAEVLATMYDASLDAIRSPNFYFYPTYISTFYIPGGGVLLTAKSAWDSKLNQSYTYRIYTVKGLSDFDVSWMDQLISTRVKSTKGGLELHSTSVASQNHTLASVGELREPTPQPQVTPRRIFNEMAFFYPHLLTDIAGNVTFSFTVPESLTRWKVNLAAHTKDLYYGYTDTKTSTQVVTQKELMVQLNLPRFVRQSDRPVLSATVVNLSDKTLTTEVRLELLNPNDNKPLTAAITGLTVQTITLAPLETRAVSWNLNALTSTDLVICKVMASAGTFSDGEQQYLPVLPNKQLVTETQPLTVSVNKTKQYTLEQVLTPAKGITPYALTVEFSPNPSWTAIQALPTVADPSTNNALDYFTAYYVNTLAGHIVQSYPKLTAVFDQWRQAGSSSALLSTLSKNQQLKTLLLEETPWVVAAKDETEQRRELALLFDLNQQKSRQSTNWTKLLKLQDASGGFTWFENMSVNRYVTYYILLNQARLNAIINPTSKPENALLKALAFADKTIADDYEQLKKQPDVNLSTMHIGDMQWFYLHLRSMYSTVKLPDASKEAMAYYTKQAETYWAQATLYGKAATALIAARNGNKTLATAILTALKEQSLTKEDMGMYWAANKSGYAWNERPVMVQTMLLEAFAELDPKTAPLDAMKTWLLRQKQTQRWDSPLSTVDAIYALLHYGQDWFNATNEVSLKLGDVTVPTASKEIGTGYIQHTYEASDIKSSMGNITVGLKNTTAVTRSASSTGTRNSAIQTGASSPASTSGLGWGAVYYQYFQNIDQIKAQGNGLTVSKQLFVEQPSATGTVMVPIAGQTLKPGDKVITRLIVTVDRTMDFVVLKDQRAACFEPAKQLSGYVWREGVGYYQTSKDASTQFFFSSLPKGSYAFEYPVYVNNAGSFTDGVATLQCLYAPEFSAHSNGGKIEVKQTSK